MTHVNGIFFFFFFFFLFFIFYLLKKRKEKRYLLFIMSIISALYISLFNITLVFRLFITRLWKSLNKSSCQGTTIVLRWMWKLVQRLTKVYLVFCRIKIYPKSFINWVILLDEWNIYYISCLIDPWVSSLKIILISMLLNQFIWRYV